MSSLKLKTQRVVVFVVIAFAALVSVSAVVFSLDARAVRRLTPMEANRSVGGFDEMRYFGNSECIPVSDCSDDLSDLCAGRTQQSCSQTSQTIRQVRSHCDRNNKTPGSDCYESTTFDQCFVESNCVWSGTQCIAVSPPITFKEAPRSCFYY